MHTSHYTVIFALISFALASLGYLYAFANSKYQEKIQRAAYGFFITATFLMTHTAIEALLMGMQTMTSGLILISALCLITLVGQIVFKMKTLGTFVAPLATLLLLIQIFLTEPHGTHTSTRPEGLIAAHIYTSVIGEAFAILAFVISLLYLIQKRAMKKKQINRLLGNALSLDTLDRSLQTSIWSGFILLTIGLILGAIYTQFFLTSTSLSTSKVVWALLVWFWYLATLLSRNVFSLPPKRIAQMTLVGFALLALGVFGLY
ncbi:MAG: cytochrome c biogenesis protein CcsA [Oligoflexus sp.]